jgi:hypothetical protein
VYCLLLKLDRHDLSGLEQRLGHTFELCNCKGYFAFVDIAEHTKHCKSTDAKDRVYALLSMVTARVNPRIEPDYTKSLQEIYQDLAAQGCVIQRNVDRKTLLQ